MKVLFVMLLVGVKTINCERATNKNTRETIDFAKMKKELEDQKASLEKHATALEQQSKTNTNFRKVLRKEFRNKMEKEKIVDVELRKADAAKRQTDIAEIIMNFVASEVAKYSVPSGMKYQIFDDELKTWTEAKQFCEDRGAKLAMLQTAAEVNEAAKLMKWDNHYWIGDYHRSGQTFLTLRREKKSGNNIPEALLNKQRLNFICEARDPLFEELAKKDEELTAKDVELTAKVEELTAKEVEFTAKDVELTAKVEELMAKDVEFTAKDVELTAKDVELTGMVEELTAKVEELTAKVEELTAKVEELTAKDGELTAKDAELTAKDVEFKAKDVEFKAKDVELTAKDAELTAKDAEFKAKDVELTAKDAELTAKVEELTAKVEELIPPKRVRLLNVLGGSRLDTTTKSSWKSGRLEVWFKGEWGTVCSDGFDDNDAWVVCKTLGFTGGAKLFSQGYGMHHGSDASDVLGVAEIGRISNGPIWFDEIACTGFEQDFLDCPRPLGLNVHDCSHHQDVFMKCT